MKHVASRLARYADENKVIHIDDVLDVALKHLAKDKTINHKIRSSLKDIDDQLELLIPWQVDDPERQFKRYLQRQFGLVINLSDLKKNYPSKYRKLQNYGSPSEVIKRWGLSYTYGRNIEVKQFKPMLNELAENGTIRRLYSRNRKLYKAILHQAKKEGLTVKGYVERLGFKFE